MFTTDSCTPAAPISGTITPTTVTHGTLGTYACNAGYTLTGTATQSCSAGEMSGSTPSFDQGSYVLVFYYYFL